MGKRTTKIIIGFVAGSLFMSLTFWLGQLPGGLWTPGWFHGILIASLIVVGSLMFTAMIFFLSKRISFWLVFFLIIALSSLAFHFILYSPTLKIVVPNNYTGEVNLVLSNVSENILNVDDHGIGYINEWTFNNTYTRPFVMDENGNDLSDQCVGFNPSSFWAHSSTRKSNSEVKIHSLKFELVPRDKIGQKQYYHFSLSEFVDESKLK